VTQREYAAEIGIGERSLRSYIARFAPSAAPLERVRKVLADTLKALTEVQARLEALGIEEADRPAMGTITDTPTMEGWGDRDGANTVVQANQSLRTPLPTAHVVSCCRVLRRRRTLNAP
jgi:hypothetical protein